RRPFNQDASSDERDGTFASHGIQPDGDTFPRRAYDRRNFPVRQGNIYKDSFGLRNAITVRKLGQKAVKPDRNGVPSEICQAALGMFKPLTDQTESVIMKSVILSHPPFEIPDLDS